MSVPLSSNAGTFIEVFAVPRFASPITYPLSLGTASAQLVPENLSRGGITFANPGTVTVYICPALDVYGNPVAAGGGGSIPIAPGAFLSFTGQCGCAWNGAAASGTNNPFTVLEFLG